MYTVVCAILKMNVVIFCNFWQHMVHAAAEPKSVTAVESAILTDTLVTQGSSNLRFTCTCGYIYVTHCLA